MSLCAMTVSELINPNIPPLRPGDSLEFAQSWLNEFKISALPVVEDGRYLGMVTEMALLDHLDAAGLVSDLPLENSTLSIPPQSHFSEFLKISSRYGLDSLAVVSENNQYEGVICLKDCATALSNTLSIQSEGGILEVSLYRIDYSLSQISRLIESENAKVLVAYLQIDPNDHRKLILTLKLDQKDLSRIVATLARFDYQIVGRYDDSTTEPINIDRLDILFRLFDI